MGENKKFKISSVASILIIPLIIVFCLGFFKNMKMGEKNFSPQDSVAKSQENNAEAELGFIDIGQGMASLIIADGKTVLIDAGPEESGTKLQMELQKKDISKIDLLILSHNHEDHIGGADVIITKFQIGQIIMSAVPGTCRAYENVLDAAKYRNIKITELANDAEVKISDQLSIDIFVPDFVTDDLNNTSLFCQVHIGNVSMSVAGDAEKEEEEWLLRNKVVEETDIYVVNHHGSSSSSSPEFLDRIKPKCAVISCAKGNDFGHPHKSVLKELKNRNVKIWRTDEQGTVFCTVSGNKVNWSCPSSTSWAPGEEKQNN